MTDPAREQAIQTLDWACQFYCDWYDKGTPRMEGAGVAYELVTAIREALAALRPTGTAQEGEKGGRREGAKSGADPRGAAEPQA
jgi:hypothetical protein